MKFLEKNLSIKNILNIHEDMTKIECLNEMIKNIDKIDMGNIREYNELILLNNELSKIDKIDNDVKDINDEIDNLKKYINVLHDLKFTINKSGNEKFIYSVDKIKNYVNFFEKNYINIVEFNNIYIEYDKSLQKTIDKILINYDKDSILVWLRNININYNELTNGDLLSIKKIHTTNELLNEFSVRIKNNKIDVMELINFKDILFFDKNIENLINLDKNKLNKIISSSYELSEIVSVILHDKHKMLNSFNEGKIIMLLNKAVNLKTFNTYHSIIDSIENKIDDNDLYKNKIEYSNLINLFLTDFEKLLSKWKYTVMIVIILILL